MDLCINSKISPYKGPIFKILRGPHGDLHLATLASTHLSIYTLPGQKYCNTLIKMAPKNFEVCKLITLH